MLENIKAKHNNFIHISFPTLDGGHKAPIEGKE
jgi:hypothetical protein